MDESKYKALKSKHDLLKEAFKKLYGDYETLKGDLTLKIEEYAKLHEENTHLKQSYDLLADEVSSQNQKSAKPGPSSWTNPLTLIKGTGQQTTTDSDNQQKLNEEIASLKSRLESSMKENEMLQVQNLQNVRDLEDTKAKHSVVLTELKDRIISLENILKDLQDQSNKNETKLSQYSSEVKSLNAELEEKSSEINNLNRCLDKAKKDHEREASEWKRKMEEKFKFDLRTSNFINYSNIYQNVNELDTLPDSLSTSELFRVLLSSLKSVFKSWRQAFRFLEFSRITNEEETKEEEEEEEVHNQDQYSKEGVSFTSLSNPENLHLSNKMDELASEIEEVLVKILRDFDSLSRKMEDGVFDSEQYVNLSNLVENLKTFFKSQRVYFCVEEYLVPYGSNSQTKEVKRQTEQLICVLGSLCRIVKRFYSNLRSVLYLVQWKKSLLAEFSLVFLQNESERSNSESYGSEGSEESKINYNYKSEMIRVNSLLENNTKNMYSLVKRLTTVTNEFKESMSHRLCQPKVNGGWFLPLSGGTNQMVNLTSCITSLERDLGHLTEYRVKSSINYLFTSLKILSNSDNYYDFTNNEVQTHSTIRQVSECNEVLANSQPRIKLVNLEKDLYQAKRNENELSDLKVRYSDMEEMLALATHRSERYENELETLKQKNILEELCAKNFKKLEEKYMNYNYESKEVKNEQLENELVESNKKIKKLSIHIKHLIKTVTSMEDTNKQLKLALELNKEQYKQAKENEDSIHKNYNDQLVLMSEHISELNNAILASEYKIAELTQTKVSCPSCGFNNTLGSMMGVDDKGRCSSCRCIVIFSTN